MKTKVSFFCDNKVYDALDVLSSHTKVDKSKYIIEGIRMVLEKYRNEMVEVDKILKTLNRM